MRKENGITLIALIITIVILVILAAVSIRAVTNMGIVGHAINGTQKYAEGAVAENEMLGTTGNTIDSALARLQEIQGEAGNNSNNNSTSLRASITPAPTGSTYTIGQEVTFGDEQFFVLSDDGTTVELLAKYCLNKAGTAQVNDDYNSYEADFSTTNYWSSDFTNDPYDLNQITPPNTATAINTAISYGTAKGVKGRLMTYTEANTIESGNDTTMKNILYARYSGTDAVPDGDFKFWLATAESSWSVYAVRFLDEGTGAYEITGATCTYNTTGIRPVLEVR